MMMIGLLPMVETPDSYATNPNKEGTKVATTNSGALMGWILDVMELHGHTSAVALRIRAGGCVARLVTATLIWLALTIYHVTEVLGCLWLEPRVWW